MCLATAFTNKEGVETVVAQYVAKVEFQDGNVILTDILGQETQLPNTSSTPPVICFTIPSPVSAPLPALHWLS